MNFQGNKKLILGALLILLILGIGEIKIAHAFDLFDIGDFTANAISSIAQGIGYLFGFIGGVFMSLAGYLVQFALNINFTLLQSPTVQAGWQIMLNLANLGFVLAIIIIAFATIFRWQGYRMQQTLWKLIVAALLVNFSLMIAGAFISVSDIFSNFFMKQGGIQDPVAWSNAFAGMFRAQALLQVSKITNTQGFLDTTTAVVNTFTGQMLTTIASLFFIAIFTVLAALTLLATAIMLFIRYVFLGILLILSPIVWLCWILPSTSHLWQRWWQNFLKWTFFSPIMLFFIYLALYTMQNQPENVKQFMQNPQALASVNLTFGVEIIAQMVLVIGLVMGGLIAANSLGITFASTAYGWAQGISKSFGGWVGRKGIQAGTSPLRSKLGTDVIEAIERFGTKKGQPRKTRWGKTWQLMTQPIRSQVGERLSSLAVAGGEKAVNEAGQKYKDWDDKRGARAIYTMNAPERAYWLQRLRKNKTLDLLPDASAFINPETENLLVKYGQPRPDYRSMERAIGYDADSLRALREGPFEKEIEDEATGEKKMVTVTLENAKNAYWKDFRPEYVSKMQVDDYFRARPEFGLSREQKKEMHEQDVKAILETNPDILANVYRGIKGKNLDNFNEHLFNFMRKQATLAGKKSVRAWLDTDPKYKKVVTFFGSSAAKSLGINIDIPLRNGAQPPFTTA